MNYPKHPLEAYLTRKDKLDTIGGDMALIASNDKLCAEAWRDLSRRLVDMGEPHAARLPKFNDLLLAIVSATAKAMAQAEPSYIEEAIKALREESRENCA